MPGSFFCGCDGLIQQLIDPFKPPNKRLFYCIMKILRFSKTGFFVILLGIGMFFFGVSMFTYQGKALNPIVSKLGMYSFFFWLPTIIVGIFITVKKNKVTLLSYLNLPHSNSLS